MTLASSAPNHLSRLAPRRELAWRQDVPALLGLILLAAYFVSVSWRRWPDPLIDFGRELYTPWRLAHGAVLYRDVDAIYGPLSQYVNAALFALFGPGLMVLVAANLVVFAGILALLYVLFRRAWGMLAALVAGGVFVAVFGFSQLDLIGNYNFAAPYAHETTHGFLTCLLLVAVLNRWMEAVTPGRSLLAGGLLGVTAVLKPEFMLAGSLVTLAAGVLRWRRIGAPGWRAFTAWLTGAVLPTLFFAGWFMRDLPASDALAATCRAWLNVIASSSITGDIILTKLLGLDQPWVHFVEHAWATVLALVLVVVLVGGAWVGERTGNAWLGRGAGCLVVAALAWSASSWLDWLLAGRCLLGLVALYLAATVFTQFSAAGTRDESGTGSTRLLLAVLAAAFMLRMALHGRLGHYGFWQAALAGMLVPAILIGELPTWIRADRRGRAIILAGTLALVGPGVVAIALESRQLLQARTLPVGEGRDLFYAFPPSIFPTGALVHLFAAELRKQPAGGTLLVLPEGVMINYLARMPSPVAPFLFFSFATSDGREAALVRQLEARPPDRVAIISRDLREYGIQRYGESPGHGQLLLDWVDQSCAPVARWGGEPLDVDQFGGVLLHCRVVSGR